MWGGGSNPGRVGESRPGPPRAKNDAWRVRVCLSTSWATVRACPRVFCGSVVPVVSAVGICLQNVAGLVLALAGMIWYSYLKMPPAPTKAKDAPPTPADADHTNNVEPGGFLEAEGTPPPTLWGGGGDG